jgi:hypothetical protein
MTENPGGEVGGKKQSPLLDRRGGAKRRGGCSTNRILNNHPVCGFAAATPPVQEGRSLFPRSLVFPLFSHAHLR